MRDAPAVFVGALLAEALSGAALPATAKGIAFVADGVTRGDDTRAYIGGAVVALSAAAFWTLGGVGVRLRGRLREQTSAHYDRRFLNAALTPPTLDHLHDPDAMNALFRANEAIGQSGFAVNAILNATGTAAKATSALGILYAADRKWLLLAVAAIPMVLADARSVELVEAADATQASSRRKARALVDAAVDPTTSAQLRLADAYRSLHQRVDAALGRDVRSRVVAVAQGTLLRLAAIAGFVGALTLLLLSGESPSTGDLVVTVLLGMQLSGLLQGLSQSATAIVSASVPIERLRDLERRSRTGDTQTVGDEAGAVSLEKVFFNYGDVHALRDVSLRLAPGTVVGIVGENGAGKSTLVKTIQGLLTPTSGYTSRREGQMSGVAQDYARFELSLVDAIGFGSPTEMWSQDSVSKAVNETGIESLVTGLTDGLDTQLGRQWGGAELSGGEWQLTAFARSAMRPDAVLLTMDEPTAAIDPDREDALLRSLAAIAARARSQGALVLVVSHRLSLMRVVDRILCLEHGQIVEDGSHDELMALSGGRYQRMFVAQSEGYQ